MIGAQSPVARPSRCICPDRTMRKLAQRLREGDLPDDLPCVIVSNATVPSSKFDGPALRGWHRRKNFCAGIDDCRPRRITEGSRDQQGVCAVTRTVVIRRALP